MDQKTSILINRQVPEYVREEYPLFLSFIEAYYEFLENKQGTKNNDLTTKLKALQHITDVDSSIDEFEIQFLNTFVSLLPIETSVSKDFLLKNVLPLYQSKGSENSFKFLFRLLFSEEPQLKYPRDNILKASGGIWKLESTLKVSTNDIVSFYVADGETLEYKLISPNVFQVYLNGVLQTSGFKILKEYNLLEFDSPINNNDTIEVFYLSVDKNLFANRKFTGLNSGSTVITEKVFSTIINNEEVFEIYGDSRTLDGEFEIGESIVTDVIVDTPPNPNEGKFFIEVAKEVKRRIDNLPVIEIDPMQFGTLRILPDQQYFISLCDIGQVSCVGNSLENSHSVLEYNKFSRSTKFP
jgi:hypothetical protein